MSLIWPTGARFFNNSWLSGCPENNGYKPANPKNSREEMCVSKPSVVLLIPTVNGCQALLLV